MSGKNSRRHPGWEAAADDTRPGPNHTGFGREGGRDDPASVRRAVLGEDVGPDPDEVAPAPPADRTSRHRQTKTNRRQS